MTLVNEEFTEDYAQRIETLKKHHIALWDVIDSCERKGSLDSEIKNEEANQIAGLLETHPNIKAIFCNGGKSYKNLVKLLGKDSDLPVFLLPSTSPAYTIPFEKKLEEWKKILCFLK